VVSLLQNVGPVNAPVPQAALDRLAASWSRLDRARPAERAEIPLAVAALADWLACTLAVDEELTTSLGSTYLIARSEEAGGVALPGLRFVVWFLELGYELDQVVFAGTGSPHVFWELFWRPEEELPPHPASRRPADQREAYRHHLASSEVRTPAARMTTFLLSMAVALSTPRLERAEGG
jgi:hypothetical protein